MWGWRMGRARPVRFMSLVRGHRKILARGQIAFEVERR